jgi:hypothetical protein
MKQPKPDPKKNERKRKRQSRADRDKIRRMLDEHAAKDRHRHEHMVDKLLRDANERVGRLKTSGYDVDECLAELEEARVAALTAWPPQTGAAVQASMGKARVAGLIVDKQAILHGRVSASTLHGDIADNRNQLIERLREKHGSSIVDRFIAFMRNEGLSPRRIEGKGDDGDE